MMHTDCCRHVVFWPWQNFHAFGWKPPALQVFISISHVGSKQDRKVRESCLPVHMFRLCSLLGLLALANSEESSEEPLHSKSFPIGQFFPLWARLLALRIACFQLSNVAKEVGNLSSHIFDADRAARLIFISFPYLDSTRSSKRRNLPSWKLWELIAKGRMGFRFLRTLIYSIV